MKYFLDTEFIEGPQKKTFCGIPFGYTKPTIDLISIGIVSEDIETETLTTGRDWSVSKGMKSKEYYAISKDFNLKEAWNRYDLKEGDLRNMNGDKNSYKVYWIRENVLKPIFLELAEKRNNDIDFIGWITEQDFLYKNLKSLINRYGKSNKQIANEICDFIYGGSDDISGLSPLQLAQRYEISDKSKIPEFYAYYADYDWVAFCWLFGKMMDLPNGFPMYCKDLIQLFHDKTEELIFSKRIKFEILGTTEKQLSASEKVKKIKQHVEYPKQDESKAHNAIEDARWNKQLYEFLNKL
jgi:hypothetical protein